MVLPYRSHCFDWFHWALCYWHLWLQTYRCIHGIPWDGSIFLEIETWVFCNPRLPLAIINYTNMNILACVPIRTCGRISLGYTQKVDDWALRQIQAQKLNLKTARLLSRTAVPVYAYSSNKWAYLSLHVSQHWRLSICISLLVLP